MARQIQIKLPDALIEKQDEAKGNNIEDKPWDLNEARCLSWVRIGLLLFGAISSVTTITIVLWHLLTPTSWRWLSTTDLDRLSNFALSIVAGLLISGMTTYFFYKK